MYICYHFRYGTKDSDHVRRKQNISKQENLQGREEGVRTCVIYAQGGDDAHTAVALIIRLVLCMTDTKAHANQNEAIH